MKGDADSCRVRYGLAAGEGPLRKRTGSLTREELLVGEAEREVEACPRPSPTPGPGPGNSFSSGPVYSDKLLGTRAQLSRRQSPRQEGAPCAAGAAEGKAQREPLN
jgi:hypothetical protein